MYSQSLRVFWEKTLSPFCEYDVLREKSEQEHTTFVVNFTLIHDVLLQRGDCTLKGSQRRSEQKKTDELSFNYMAFFYFTYKFCWPDGLVSEVACRLENGLNVIFLYHIKHLTFNQSDKILSMKQFSSS